MYQNSSLISVFLYLVVFAPYKPGSAVAKSENYGFAQLMAALRPEK